MTKWVCSVCGYVYEGEKAPEACPVCKAPAEKFVKQGDEMTWAAEHVVGVAQGSSEDIMADNIMLGEMAGYTKEWNINGEDVVFGVVKVTK